MSSEQTGVLEKIEQTLAGTSGMYGLAAWSLQPNLAKEAILVNAEQIYPTASTIKVPILYELYRQAEAGRVNLSQRLELQEGQLVAGSGVLQDLGAGLQPSVRDLAVLMTVVSDNTATDLILDLVGLENIEPAMQALGLNQIKAPMTIREMLYSLAGLDATNPAHTYKMVRAVFADPTHKADPACRALSETDNVTSTPHDLAQLLTLIARHEVLSEKSGEDILDIMSRQKYRTRIPLYLPSGTRVAHKTGSLSRVCNDVGVVYASTGLYVVALMSKQVDDEVEADHKLAVLSKLVYDYFVA